MSEIRDLKRTFDQTGSLDALRQIKKILVSTVGIDAAADMYNDIPPGPHRPQSYLSIQGLHSFIRSRGLFYNELSPAGQCKVRTPRGCTPAERGEQETVCRRVFVGMLETATVTHRSSFIETDGVLLLDIQDDEQDAIKSIYTYDPLILENTDTVAYKFEMRSDTMVPCMKEAIHLGGTNSYEFGHWIFEYILKFAGATKAHALPQVPILIDSGMPLAHKQAITLFFGSRPIVEIPRNARVCVDRLWIMSNWSYVPIFPAPGQDLGPRRLSPPIDQYADLVRWLSACLPKISDHSGKLFLARKPSQHRKMLNTEDVLSVLSANGFRKIYQEEHTFETQMNSIRAANEIVGPEGSALYLSIFAKPGTKVTILNHPFVENIATFTTILEHLEIDAVLLPGECVNYNYRYPRFSDYEIDLQSLDKAIKR